MHPLFVNKKQKKFIKKTLKIRIYRKDEQCKALIYHLEKTFFDPICMIK
tara:strand:- start:334 stop:480 length:147 start_codon:yes stop_codon:yes gene_type:complete